jgi:hypothetical protein
VNQVPLNGGPDADQVNFFEHWLIVDQKVTYHNSWVTDQTVSKQNVVELVRAGRARWKIETETFNTSKIKVTILSTILVTAKNTCRTTFFSSNSTTSALKSCRPVDNGALHRVSISKICLQLELLLAREIMSIRPDMPIIICTGLSEKIGGDEATAIGVKALLMKPVAASEMSRSVRQVLDGK